MCIYTYVYICMYMFTYIHVYVCKLRWSAWRALSCNVLEVGMYIYIYVYICMYMFTYIHVYVCKLRWSAWRALLCNVVEVYVFAKEPHKRDYKEPHKSSSWSVRRCPCGKLSAWRAVSGNVLEVYVSFAKEPHKRVVRVGNCQHGAPCRATSWRYTSLLQKSPTKETIFCKRDM